MLGMTEYLMSRSAFYDHTLVKDGDAIANSRDGCKIVRDVENGHADGAVEFAKQRENLGLRDHIESARGFISYQQRGTMHDSHRDQHPLRLSYAHLRRIFALKFIVSWKGNILERSSDCVCTIRTRAGRVRPPRFLKLSADLQRRIQRSQRTLQDQRNCATPQPSQFALRKLQEIGILEPDCAFGLNALLVEKSENGHGQRALARAALAHQSKHFAALDFDFHIPQNRLLARIAHREAGGQQSLVGWRF